MAGDKFLYNNGGVVTEKAATQVGGGSYPNQIPALDGTGRLDTTMMPVGVGPEVQNIATSESLAAGDFVNIYNNTGTLNVRKADASSVGKEANGFVLAVFTHPTTAIVYLLGGVTNTAATCTTKGARQYLSASAPGKTVEAAESYASGARFHQLIGKAISTTEMTAEAHDYIVLTA